MNDQISLELLRSLRACHNRGGMLERSPVSVRICYRCCSERQRGAKKHFENILCAATGRCRSRLCITCQRKAQHTRLFACHLLLQQVPRGGGHRGSCGLAMTPPAAVRAGPTKSGHRFLQLTQSRVW